MKSRPLPDEFCPGSAVFDLISCSSRLLLTGGISDTAAAGLNGMHLNACQFLQDVRHFFQPGPVKLEVLPGRKMAVTFIVIASDMSQFSNLPAGEHAVRNSDA